MKHDLIIEPILAERQREKNRAKRKRQILAGTRAAQERRNKVAKLKRKRKLEYESGFQPESKEKE